MGLLTDGNALSWSDTQLYSQHVKYHGIQQFINIYFMHKNRKNDLFLWGDELEYQLIKSNKKSRSTQLYLNAEEILVMMKEKSKIESETSDKLLANIWHVEFGSHMIESTPFLPYNNNLLNLLIVEQNMSKRREKLLEVLKNFDDVHVHLIPTFPRLGAANCLFLDNFVFNEQFIKANTIINQNTFHRNHDSTTVTIHENLLHQSNVATNSIFMSDAIILQNHPRFLNLAKNIRLRRGSKPKIHVPIFRDLSTSNPFIDELPYGAPNESLNFLKPDHIYMDSMAFGMSCCSLQVTMQACDLENAKQLYDQLIVIAPLMLALSAGSPIWKGLLSDIDCRWKVISQSVDDRTSIERSSMENYICDENDDSNTQIHIPKSRYDGVSMYLSKENDIFNDPMVIDKRSYKQMMDNGVDELIARHIAHLFIRDPLVILENNLQQDDTKETNHFENIQSTNWQSLRFKPPPSLDKNCSIGWRVEFRTMECQLTDFENASYAIFVSLLGRALVHFKCPFSIPISLVNINMENAVKRDAVNSQFFYFKDNHGNIELMKINEIINGKEHVFIGLINVVQKYMLEISPESLSINKEYLDFISLRALGKIPTLASWIRQYVINHPEYCHDSIVSDSVVYDLLNEFRSMSTSKTKCNELYGKAYTVIDQENNKFQQRNNSCLNRCCATNTLNHSDSIQIIHKKQLNNSPLKFLSNLDG